MNMKKKLKILFAVLLCLTFIPVRAEEQEDMSKFSFKILLQHADQLDELKVVRFYNSETDRFAFCMEALVDYSPKDNVYVKNSFFEKRIFDIYRAFTMLGEDYYIAAQLMIWEVQSGIRYSFDGKDAADYGEQEIEDLIKSFEEIPEDRNLSFDLAKDQVHTLTIEGLEDYEVAESDIEIIGMKGDLLSIRMSDKDEQIVLKPKYDMKNDSFLYHSETSQDLYSFEGEYIEKGNIILTLHPIDENYSYQFMKTDGSGTPIEGAMFSLYRLDEAGEEDILMIRKGTPVDLCDVYDELTGEENILTSERYQKYFDDTKFDSDELGVFRYETEDERISGIGMVCDELPFAENIRRSQASLITEHVTDGSSVQSIDGLESGGTYLLVEIKPARGYGFSNDPCVFIDNFSKDKQAHFVNSIRDFDLKLYKENSEHTILLDDARFELSYTDEGEERRCEFVTGALNILQDEEGGYVYYRHENEENISIGTFKNGSFVLRNARPGRYFYSISEDENSRSLNRTTYVSQGSIFIQGIPYDSKIDVKELEAPKGYFIEEAEYQIAADLDYDEITYKNYRVNEFIILANKKHKIPKTCIGN